MPSFLRSHHLLFAHTIHCFLTLITKVYGISGGGDGEIVTRFTLPVRSVAINHDGSALAASGDADGIKIVSTKDYKVRDPFPFSPDMAERGMSCSLSLSRDPLLTQCRVFQVLRVLQSGPQMRDIVYDPEGTFLASVNCSGSVQVRPQPTTFPTSRALLPPHDSLQSTANFGLLFAPCQVWDVAKAQAILTHKGAAPTTDHMSADRARPSWHPNGSVLAVPGSEVSCLPTSLPSPTHTPLLPPTPEKL